MNPIRTAALLALVLLFGASTAAGQYSSPIYYPQATTTEILGSWQFLGSGSIDDAESRYQVLIPARYLPQQPANLVGIAVINNGSAPSFTYDMLEITASNAPIASLSTIFDLNLPNPVTLVSAPNAQVGFVQGAWSQLPLNGIFAHDGVGSLVLDVRKAINRATNPSVNVEIQSTSTPRRDDLPRAIWDVSQFGNGAFFSAQATAASPLPIKLRLTFSTVPTLSVRSDISGTPLRTFARGGSAEIRINAPAASPFLLLVSASFQPGIAVPGVQGRLILALPFYTLGSGTVPPSAQSLLSFGIPFDPTLVGVPIAFQAVVQVASTLHLTNGGDAIIR